MGSFRDFLKGKKTYLAAISAIIIALISFAEGGIEFGGLLQAVITAILGVTIRAGIAKNSSGEPS